MRVTECIFLGLKTAVQLNQGELSYLSTYQVCENNYYIGLFFFIACEDNCKTCSDATTCTGCNDGYKLENENCAGTSSYWSTLGNIHAMLWSETSKYIAYFKKIFERSSDEYHSASYTVSSGLCLRVSLSVSLCHTVSLCVS